MADGQVAIVITHDGEHYMGIATENPIKSGNVPAAARLLMDGLYLQLDDQVSAAKLRAHRRRLRDKHREKAVEQVNAGSEEEADE